MADRKLLQEKSLPPIRLAMEHDAGEIYSLDSIAEVDEHRRGFILRSIHAENCFVFADGEILGYGVLEYTFYDNGFISMLVVHPAHRRQGVGAELMKYFEAICQTGKLFTSTNLSNLPMQSLLARLGYKLSGVVNDLDIGDPELIYVKYLCTEHGIKEQ